MGVRRLDRPPLLSPVLATVRFAPRNSDGRLNPSIPMPMISLDPPALQAAAAQLNRSDRGQRSMRDLLDLLDHGAHSLDSDNQHALLTLLVGAWGSHRGSSYEAMRAALGID